MKAGYGVSTPKSYTVLDFARDVWHLLVNHLGYEQYHTYAVSGGGPYSLGLAYLAIRNGSRGDGIMRGSAPLDAGRNKPIYRDLHFRLTFSIPWALRR